MLSIDIRELLYVVVFLVVFHSLDCIFCMNLVYLKFCNEIPINSSTVWKNFDSIKIEFLFYCSSLIHNILSSSKVNKNHIIKYALSMNQ